METMQEVQQTTHDDYGLKATGILAALILKASSYFLWWQLKMYHVHYKKRIYPFKMPHLRLIKLASVFYRRQRTDEAFKHFFDEVVI